MYDTQMDSELVFNQTLLPFYQSLACGPFSNLPKSFTDKDYSGLTCNVPRKRPRDPISDSDAKFSCSSSFLDEDIISQIQHQQSELDRFVAEHTKNLRVELEERRKKQSRMLLSAIQQRINKKLKEKDEEIQRMGKLIWVLQERVKSLYVENQIWRDLAHTNEATANSLRSNLEQVLVHVSDEHHVSGGGGATVTVADDAKSSCGSSDHERCRFAGEEEVVMMVVKDKAAVGMKDNNRKCKQCGEKEVSVLLLPCRHLCLCTFCGSTLLGTCPVCDSGMTGSVHVNLS